MGEQLANGGLRWKDEKHKDTLSIWRAFWASPDSAGWFWAHWMQLMVPFFPHLDNAACYGVKKWLKKKQTKSLPANAGAVGWIPGSGRSPGEGNGSPLQCSCLGNPTDRGAWWATVLGVTKELGTTDQLNNNSVICNPPRDYYLEFPSVNSFFPWLTSSHLLGISSKATFSGSFPDHSLSTMNCPTPWHHWTLFLSLTLSTTWNVASLPPSLWEDKLLGEDILECSWYSE